MSGAEVGLGGQEFIVEGYGCRPAELRDAAALQALFDAIVAALALHPVAAPLWHRFPEPGGLTGFVALAESHLACHTFPEHGSICLNLYCCRPREPWDFAGELARRLGATSVRVRVITRPHVAPASVSAVPSPQPEVAA